ncbi:MAG: DUF1501 domain-containing protein [Acidobacteria bacterium]|nr:DUF1501 domain-containing protein [Acidobacteriota bacterium]
MRWRPLIIAVHRDVGLAGGRSDHPPHPGAWCSTRPSAAGPLAWYRAIEGRVEENANRGTDHGHAAPMLLLGGNVAGGVHGTFPGLEPGNIRESMSRSRPVSGACSRRC